MEKLSNLISKKIYSFSEGLFVGTILNVSFDEKLNLLSVIAADDENDRELSVPFNSVIINDASVFVRSINELSRVVELPDRVIGKSVFSNKGQFFGIVKDVYLSKKSAVCFVTDKISFSPSQIGVCGDVIILGKVTKAEADNVFSERQDEQKVVAMADGFVKEEPSVPYRVSTDPKSLIGKIATKDIFGLNNEILLKKYEIITQKKLLEVKKHNKLNILFYNCK